VDTAGAIAAAIGGAYLGLERLPPVLAQQLNDQGTWGFKDRVELAHCCYDVKTTFSLREMQGLY
jgi:ADP-ribosylglycohydrolase